MYSENVEFQIIATFFGNKNVDELARLGSVFEGKVRVRNYCIFSRPIGPALDKAQFEKE